MHNLSELKVWFKAIDLSTKVYMLIDILLNNEKLGLSSQIKRSVVSIASNIAEGAGRNPNREFVHFLGIANGSAYELQTQVIIAQNLEMLDKRVTEEICTQITEIQKMIFGFQNKLRNELK